MSVVNFVKIQKKLANYKDGVKDNSDDLNQSINTCQNKLACTAFPCHGAIFNLQSHFFQRVSKSVYYL